MENVDSSFVLLGTLWFVAGRASLQNQEPFWFVAI